MYSSRRFTSWCKEDHKEPIFGVAFNPYNHPDHPPVFATVGLLIKPKNNPKRVLKQEAKANFILGAVILLFMGLPIVSHPQG